MVEANLRKKFNVNIIAVENDGNLIEIVAPNYVFRKGDILYVSGSKAGLGKLSNWAQ